MIWTAWNNGAQHESGAGYGFKIAAADRDRYFSPGRQTVTVERPQGTGSVVTKVNIAKRSFWSTRCREGYQPGHWPLAARLRSRPLA
jgi:hypothetical protein